MPRKKIDHSLLAAFAAAGVPDIKIARHYGVAKETVFRWRKKENIPSPQLQKPLPHGTASGYERGCRCAECRGANTARRSFARENSQIPAGAKHGVSVANNYGCKCDVCREDSRDYHSRYYREAISTGRIRHVRGGHVGGCPCGRCGALGLARTKKVNDETRKGATSHRNLWTSAQMDVAASPKYTAMEASKILGRTKAAVTSMRKRLRHDPKYSALIEWPIDQSSSKD
jgi:hypothetical protein